MTAHSRRRGEHWAQAAAYWRTLVSDSHAHFDRIVAFDADAVRPMVSWGASPEMVSTIDQVVLDPSRELAPVKRAGVLDALRYIDLAPGTPLRSIRPDNISIGSCAMRVLKTFAPLPRCFRDSLSLRLSALRLLSRAPGWSRRRRSRKV
jgi:homoaconitase/3-isopropylmalate dehydratase large subunit